jgi:hypothetical protein
VLFKGIAIAAALIATTVGSAHAAYFYIPFNPKIYCYDKGAAFSRGAAYHGATCRFDKQTNTVGWFPGSY